jgi:hypothetical protein
MLLPWVPNICTMQDALRSTPPEQRDEDEVFGCLCCQCKNPEPVIAQPAQNGGYLSSLSWQMRSGLARNRKVGSRIPSLVDK